MKPFYADNLCTLYRGNSEDVLPILPAESVDLVLTSPPYDNLRTYGGYCFDFENIAAGLVRILKPGGVIAWNVADATLKGSETLTSFRQALHFKDVCGLSVHDTMIWHKLNFSSPSFNRYHSCFEYVFIFSKGAPKTFNPIKDKPNSTAGRLGNLGTNTFMKRDGERETRSKHVTAEFGMRHNVWTGPTRGQEDMCEQLPHPAMMPKWLVRDLILSWSNQNETVVDPFAGSGTTIEQAKKQCRFSIGIEQSAEYCEGIAKQQTQQVFGI